jgi:hypothetical protein
LRNRPARDTQRVVSDAREGVMDDAGAGETGAVVFVCDRQGAALQRRERCLKLAGIIYRVEAERRPSGTYYKLCVRETDAVAAHLALQMGGCNRSSRLRQANAQPSVTATLREIGRTLWDEVRLLVGRLVDYVASVAPKLLTGPTAEPSDADGAGEPSGALPRSL